MDKVDAKRVLCCRIEADAYWDEKAYTDNPKVALPAVQFVCVYFNKNGVWARLVYN